MLDGEHRNRPLSFGRIAIGCRGVQRGGVVPGGQVHMLSIAAFCGLSVTELPLELPVVQSWCACAGRGIETESRVLTIASAVWPNAVQQFDLRHDAQLAAALLITLRHRFMRLHEQLVRDLRVSPLSGRFVTQESNLVEQHFFVKVSDVVQAGLECACGVLLAVLPAFFGVATGPVDERLAINEAEAGFVGCGAEAIISALRQAQPAVVQAQVIIGVAEWVEAILNIAVEFLAIEAGLSV